MSFKKPNITCSRFRQKSKRIISNKEFQIFRSEYPEHSRIKLKLFNEIMIQFHKDMVDGVINEPFGIKFPQRLGFLVIVSYDMKMHKSIDFNKSAKEGKKVFFSNWDTENRQCKIVWFNQEVAFTNHRMWWFKGTKAFAKKVSDAYLKRHEDYLYIGASQKMDVILKNKKR